ncbi:MAG: UbiA prenyltransferase family protein [Alphaproteobacteria bacterium]|nr:UbiA prenyltransferase family protein [Alphaproteobacteria bacterium]
MTVENLGAVLTLFVGFCFVSSAVYCFNDFRDFEADKEHPVKRGRPLPSGQVAPAGALVLAVLLVVVGMALIAWRTPGAVTIVAAYLVINLCYSLGLKRVSIVDVLLISIGFVLRVDAGAAAIDVAATPWIQICAGLLALFIALAKRRDDLVRELGAEHRESLRGYSKQYLDVSLTVVMAALLVSYLIFTVDDGAMERLGSDKIYLTVPFVVAGLLRYLQVTLVEQRSGSPTELLFKDVFLVTAVVGWVLCYVVIIYT